MGNRAEGIHIDLSDPFPHLTKAPIVEAVLEIREQVQGQWEEEPIISSLKKKLLKHYPNFNSRRKFEQKFKAEIGKKTVSKVQDRGWQGVQFTSKDKIKRARFERNFFSFGQLAPYPDWTTFFSEAMKLWKLHQTFAHIEHANRLGLRFINRIPMNQSVGDDLENYLEQTPHSPSGLKLPVMKFFYHDTHEVPSYPYSVNIVRTIQRDTTTNDIGIILDIDVYTNRDLPIEDEVLQKSFDEMHWLKNKIFFGSITETLLEYLK